MRSRFIELLDRLDARWWLSGAVAACLVFGVTECHARDQALIAKGRLEADLKTQRAATALWEAKYQDQGRELATASAHVTREVTRYKTLRDTLILAPTTAADTVRSLEQFPAFVRQSDSTVRACSEFQTECQRFHVTADSLIRSTQAERDVWRRAAQGQKRRNVLERVTDIGIALGAGYLAGRARVPR